MFCKNCGTQLPEDGKFCTNCGASVETAAAQPAEAPVAEVPATEVPVAEAPATEAPFAQPQFETPVQPPKKKKSPLVWLIPVIAVVAAVAVAAALLLDPLQGWFKKSFGSEVDYREYVQANSQETAVGAISEVYGSVLGAFSGKTSVGGAADVTMQLKVGDKVVTLLEDLTKEELGEKVDMDWAKNIELKLSANVTEQLQQIGAALNISDKEIAVADAIINMDKGKLFVAVTSMSSKYLELDFSEYLPTDQTTPVWMQMLEDPELIKALPTEEELDALLDKYITIVMDNLDDVEKTAETVKVGDLEQKLTALKTTIDAEDVQNAAVDVLEAAAKDQQLEKIISKAVGYLASREELGFESTADEVYEMFQEGIGDALEEVKGAQPDTIETKIVLTEYVNGSHEIVGYALKTDAQEVFRMVEIRSGDKLAFELKIPEALEIAGEGTEKKGVTNAAYTVSTNALTLEMMEIATVSLVDFKAEDEAVNGKIRLAPSSDLLKAMDLSTAASSAFNLADLQLELGLATGKKSSTVEINALSGEDLLVGLSLTGAEKKATAITEPKDACDMENIEQWLEGLDTDKLLDALDDAGLPVRELIFGETKAQKAA